jgi:hypothetical protein
MILLCCHPERSEGSGCYAIVGQILRYAQDDILSYLQGTSSLRE